MAVLADHGGVAGASGGFVGVDVFFVLSGFLITSLLLAEHRRTDRIDLAGFWTRRARRLLPALVVMAVAVGLGCALFPPDAVAGLRGDAIAAFFWVANWRFVTQDTDYFAQGGTPSPLQHTWSLGVEEQFYLLWPLLLIALAGLIAVRARRRHHAMAPGDLRWAVFVLAAAGAVVSALGAVVLASGGSIDRVYFGTDTRVQALLIGAAASALLVRDWPANLAGSAPVHSPRAGAGLRVLPFAGLAGLAAAVHWATGSAAEFRFGLLTGVALAAVAVIASVTLDQHGPVSRVLASGPLVWLGGISYGVYLWHWPVFLMLSGERTGWSGSSLFALRCLVTLAVAAASWRWIEAPIRRWRPDPGRLLPAAAVTVAAAVGLMVLVVPVGTGPAGAVASALPPGVSDTAAAPPSRVSESLVPISPGAPAPPAQRDPARPRTVAVFGDSIAWTLMRYLPSTPGVDFIDHTQLGCGLVRGGPYRYFGQTSEQRPECDTWPSTWADQIAADRPDVVLLLVGRWETMDRLHDGRWTQIGDPAFDAYLSDELHRAFEVLGATGAQLVVATEPYNRRGEKPDGSLYPEDHPERVTRWNALVRQAVAQRPHTTLLDLNEKLSPHGVYTPSVDGIQVRSDGVHLTPEGVSWLTPWLVSSLP